MSMPNSPNHVAIIGRWRPVHLGHQAALHALCQQFEQVMLELALEEYSNYTLAPIPDTADEDEWRQLVQAAIGDPDLLVTANPYVRAMLDGLWPIAHPAAFIPHEHKVPVSGSMLRRRMADGSAWTDLVPPKITQYLVDHQLDRRFRAEFGLQTLALDAIIME